MTNRTVRLEVRCESERCKNVIAIEQNWTVGGPNDRGGFIVKCIECRSVFDVYVGEDVDASILVGGGWYLDSYDMDIEGDRNAVRKKYGIGPLNDAN
jgi:hypothetical protein